MTGTLESSQKVQYTVEPSDLWHQRNHAVLWWPEVNPFPHLSPLLVLTLTYKKINVIFYVAIKCFFLLFPLMIQKRHPLEFLV
jgi:hypothetical protein